MPETSEKLWRQDGVHTRHAELPAAQPASRGPQVVLSFDVEEHFRIEAAAGLKIDPALKAHYTTRLEPSTKWILDQLQRLEVKATFFVVGEIARSHPRLVQSMANAGHEVASHSWDHRRLHNLNPAEFREDLRKSRKALEDVTGQAVFGYRAPTFSIVAKTGWALDILAEEGFSYDSSVYPVWHDRYGVPNAPRGPFVAKGTCAEILELPPATWRALWMNMPVGGGGYFRLLPLFLIQMAIRQVRQKVSPSVAVLYFHPWEFDPGQERLPLRGYDCFRTYVGMDKTRSRFEKLVNGHDFTRAIDVARQLDGRWDGLARFSVSTEVAKQLPTLPAASTS